MRTCTGLVLGVMFVALPIMAWAAPGDAGVEQESKTAEPSPRDTSRFMLLGGLGVPDLLFIEAGYAVLPGLAFTARAGGLPPILNRLSAGLLGLIPLSSDNALVRRHSLGIQAEFSRLAILNLSMDDRVLGPGQEPDRRSYRTTIGPTVSAGYLFTSLDGIHLRVMGGAFLPVSGDLSKPTVNLQLGIGKVF